MKQLQHMRRAVTLAVGTIVATIASMSVKVAAQANTTTQDVIDTTSLPHAQTNGATITTILSIVFAILGAISVIMIVIGGIKYAGSQGDPAGTAKAKDTILYAIIGVLVALFATAIVQFTVGKVFK